MCGICAMCWICVGYVWWIRLKWICVGYVKCAGYVWDMCGVRYANNLLKNPATKRLSGKNKHGNLAKNSNSERLRLLLVSLGSQVAQHRISVASRVSKSRITISVCPHAAAKCNGVSPWKTPDGASKAQREFSDECFVKTTPYMLHGTGIFTYMNGLNLW